jgi:stearoyl-CoA desaturase (delta-9 desaturase)
MATDVLRFSDGTDARGFMPRPLSPRHETAFQWVQMFAPLAGTAAAFVHAWHYGIVIGTLTIHLFVGILTALGITVGFHRLFTHRSFEAARPVRAGLAILGAMAAQGTLFSWVASHRRHHAFSDEHGDPHSPNVSDQTTFGKFRALWHSHIGWMLTEHMTADRLRYIPDLMADPTLRRIQRWHFVWVALGFALPAAACYAIGGTLHAALGGVLWGFARIVVTDHLSFAVNSVCHVWGSRPFESQDLSRNNRPMAILAFGEGWHNNHHAFPTSARHGLRAGELDLSWLVIRLFERLGLAWNVKTPTLEQINAKLRDAESTRESQNSPAARRRAA